jgi:Spy/CpxP family protein refolding chaperone
MTSRVPLWAMVAVVGLIGCGVAIGIAVDRAWLHRRGPGSGMMGRRGGPPMGPPSAEQRDMMRRRLSRELSLTPEQSARIDTIMTRQFTAMESITGPIRPRMDSLFSATRAALDSVLTPEQREKRARMSRGRGSYGRGSFGPPSP